MEGKYGDICALVRTLTGADGALVIILGGVRGHGFSIAAPAEIVFKTPEILRDVADKIERQNNATRN